MKEQLEAKIEFRIEAESNNIDQDQMIENITKKLELSRNHFDDDDIKIIDIEVLYTENIS